MFPEEPPEVVPGKVTLLTETLSVTTAVNVTVCVCDEVLSSTLVSSALKLLIAGSSSSVLLILIVIVSVGKIRSICNSSS